MANINISIDTIKNNVKATVDDKNISDVKEIRIYKYVPYGEEEEKVMVEIVSGTIDEEAKISRTIITTCVGSEVTTKDNLTNDLIKILFPM